MKIKLFTILLGSIILASLFSVNIYASLDTTVHSYNTSTYQVHERKVEESLGYGVKHILDKASSSSRYGNSVHDRIDPQQVNILEVPSSMATRTVCWTFSGGTAPATATVEDIARDYEAKHPGWVVLAGVNGDFFDWHGKRPLPYQTTGVTVTDSDVIRPYSGTGDRQVGFTNDGSTNSLIGGHGMEFTSSHILGIFDEDNNLIKEFPVSKFNEEPTGNEISVYHTYRPTVDDIYTAHLPKENSYLCEDNFKVYAIEDGSFFGKGKITSKNTEKDLLLGSFGVVTSNEEVKKYLQLGTTIRVQKNMTGKFAACDNVTGCVGILLENGEYVVEDGHGGVAVDKHPRTLLGQKADGTIVISVVDGRQRDKGMTGMTYEEEALMMNYYGCTEAYNCDGGGSSTMIIRNEYEEFDVVNSPSDGRMRNVGNAILVVVPRIKLEISEVTDTKCKFIYENPGKDLTVKHLVANFNGEDYNVIGNTFTFSDLAKQTEYTLNYEYDIVYKEQTYHIKGNPLKFTTGKTLPTVKGTYQDLGDTYLLEFKIEDPDNVIGVASIKNGKFYKAINPSVTSVYVPKNKVTSTDFIINIDYNLGSLPNKAGNLSYKLEEYVEVVAPDNNKPEETPNKKGCGCKKKSNLMIELLSISLLLYFIKKH